MLTACGIFGPEPLVRDELLDFPDQGSKIYMRSREWGWTGDHEETRFQTSPIDNGSACVNECLIIHASEVYYSADGNALRIYAISSAVPKEHATSLGVVKVEVIEAHGYEELRNLAAKNALRKISVR